MNYEIITFAPETTPWTTGLAPSGRVFPCLGLRAARTKNFLLRGVIVARKPGEHTRQLEFGTRCDVRGRNTRTTTVEPAASTPRLAAVQTATRYVEILRAAQKVARPSEPTLLLSGDCCVITETKMAGKEIPAIVVSHYHIKI
jgi:hypothetical protein